MGSQGFRNIAGNPFVYQEDTRSAAFGLDAAAQKWKVVVSSTTGALPTGTAQFTIDPATNGDVTIDPNGSGNLVVTSGDVSLTAGNLALPTTTSAVGQIKFSTYRYFFPFVGSGGDALYPNLFIGREAGNFTMSGSSAANIGIGSRVLDALTDGQNNCAWGQDSATAITTGKGNLAIGTTSLASLTTGYNNIALGLLTCYLTTGNENIAVAARGLRYLTSGARNVAIGYSPNILGDGSYIGSGDQYTSSETGNCLINSAGVTGESNKLRIGSGTGTGIGQFNAAYISGIYGVSVGATNGLVYIDNANQLGSTNSPSVTGSFTAGTDLISTAGNLKLPNSTSSVGQIQLNSIRYFHNYGNYAADGNLFFGRNAGNFTLTTSSTKYNTAFGNDALAALTAAATANVAIGQGALTACQTGTNNCALGALYPIGSLTSGSNNFGLGTDVLRQLLTGSYNIAIGVPYNGAGRALTGSESSNIYFNNEGVAGESGVLRIGRASGETPGGGQLTKAYIHGIYGVTPGGTQNIALVDSNGQFGSTATLPPSLGGKMTWSTLTADATAAVNNGYLIKHATPATKLVVTLPATAALYSEIEIDGYTAGLWKLAQNSGQTIHFNSIDTTTGTGGYLEATNRYDSILIRCVTADTEWSVVRSSGSITIV